MCLFEDHAGTLWIGTDGGGVNAFSQGRFTPYTIAHGLPSNLVRAIVDDGNGGLLVGTSRGIARIADGRVSAYEGRADVAHADISTLARPPDGSLWVAPMSGRLYRVDSRGVTEFGPDHGLTNDRVESLFADEEGRMWIGTSTRRLVPLLRGPLRALRAGRRLAGRACAGHCARRRQRSVDWDRWRSGAIQEATRDGLHPTGRPRERLMSAASSRMWKAASGRRRGHGLTRFVNGAFKVLTTSDGLPDGRIRLGQQRRSLPLGVHGLRPGSLDPRSLRPGQTISPGSRGIA